MPDIDNVYDISITTSAAVDLIYDVSIATTRHNARFSNLSVNLASNTLSDTYNMQTVKQVNNPELDDVYTGRILDYEYTFKADSISVAGSRVTITGRYNNDKLLFTTYSYEIPINEAVGLHNGVYIFNASSYFNAIARMLGLTPHFHATDWPVKTGTLPKKVTYRQFLESLAGWRSGLQHININVFIRGTDIYLVERGKELEAGQEITITDGANVLTVPTRQVTRIRTEWSGTVSKPGVDPAGVQDYEPIRFTGTIAFGTAELVYQDGLLIRRTDGEKVTTYTYTTINEEPYLSVEEMIDNTTSACNKTEYTYYENNGILYLAEEKRYTGGILDGSTPDYTDAVIITTTHSPMPNGWYGITTINESTDEVTTTLSQGGAANSASRYTIDKANEALYGFDNDLVKWARDRLLASLLGSPIINVNFPVDTAFGRSVIRWLAQQTDWLNNAIEERITAEVVGLEHVIDFKDIVKYNNRRYCVDSNNITVATNGTRQTVTLVRWYKANGDVWPLGGT